MSRLLFINPESLKMAAKRHRRRKSARRSRRRAAAVAPVAAPKRRRSRRRRRTFSIRAKRNPIINTSGMLGDLKPAAVGAAGALANDVLVGYASRFLPPSLQVGPVKALTKAGIAILAGQLAGKFVGRDTARKATVGALTCIGYGAARDQLRVMLPSVPLGAIGDQFDAMPDPYAGRIGEIQYDALPAPGIGEMQTDYSDADDEYAGADPYAATF